MKIKQGIFGLILILLMVSAVYADDSSSSTTSSTSSSSSSSSTSSTSVDAAALVYVSNVTLDPSSFFPGDQGTVTVTLTNGGTSAIGLSHPDLMSSKLNVQANEWEGMSFVGAGSTITYSIRFTVKPPDGTYYALFSVGTQSGNAINYPIKIDVSSNNLTAAVTSKPTSFAPEAEQNVTLTLMNTRDGEIKNVVITPEGTGIDSDPSMELISTLSPCTSTDTTFGITPHEASDLVFNISYQNGDNTHYSQVELPINIGQDKTAAVPVVNNVELTSSGTTKEITGDVTNRRHHGCLRGDRNGRVSGRQQPEPTPCMQSAVSLPMIPGVSMSPLPQTISLPSRWSSTGRIPREMIITLRKPSISLGRRDCRYRQQQHNRDPDLIRLGHSMTGGPSGDMSGGPGGMGGPGGSSSSSVTSLFSGSKGGGISSFYPVIGAGIAPHCRHCPVEKAEMDPRKTEQEAVRDRT